MTHAQPTTGDWLKKRYIVNNYILLDTLGEGSYGEVRMCKERVSDEIYAIKIINKDMLNKKKNGKTSETYFEDIKREIAIMKKLMHPNVLRLFEVLDDPKVKPSYYVCIVHCIS
jgi:serine/threonine protein kinase